MAGGEFGVKRSLVPVVVVMFCLAPKFSKCLCMAEFAGNEVRQREWTLLPRRAPPRSIGFFI